MRWLLLIFFLSAGVASAQDAPEQPSAVQEHPAVTLFNHITKAQREAAFWHQKLQLASVDSASQYPCPSKTIPAVNHLMVNKILEQQNSDRFRYKMTKRLERAMTMDELRELNEYFLQTEEFSDAGLTMSREKLERIKRNLRDAGDINANETRTLERNVMRETRREVGQLIAAYANPDGSCR